MTKPICTSTIFGAVLIASAIAPTAGAAFITKGQKMYAKRTFMQVARRFKGAVVCTRAASLTAVLACLLAAPAWAQGLPPVVNPGGPYLSNHNSAIFLDGSKSYDPNGFPLTYAWDLTGSGLFADSTSAAPMFSSLLPGTFPVCLRVSDPYKSATGCTTVSAGNRDPAAVAGGPYVIGLGRSFMLDASGSLDPDGDPISFAWDLNGDGRFGDLTGAHPSLSAADSLARFAAPGTYSIGVRVTDVFGARNIQYTALNVAAVPEPATPAMLLPGLIAVIAWKARREKSTAQRR